MTFGSSSWHAWRARASERGRDSQASYRHSTPEEDEEGRGLYSAAEVCMYRLAGDADYQPSWSIKDQASPTANPRLRYVLFPGHMPAW